MRIQSVEDKLTNNTPPFLLLAEDSEDDAFFFRRALLKIFPDCQMTHVENGSAAIDYLTTALSNEKKGRIPDLVFLDLKMPVLSGFDVLEWIQLHDVSKRLRPIVLSGSDHVEDKNKASRLGAVAYMVKPIRAETLKNQIDRLESLQRNQGPQLCGSEERN